jgi:hypothetical protein
MDNWEKFGDPKILANGEKTYKNYTFNHKYRLVQQNIIPLIVSRKSVLISTKPMAFTLETDIPSFQLPPEINLETITAINKLPEKSIMLLTNKKHYFQFSALTTENTLVFKIFDLDGALAIETPIKILASK